MPKKHIWYEMLKTNQRRGRASEQKSGEGRSVKKQEGQEELKGTFPKT